MISNTTPRTAAHGKAHQKPRFGVFVSAAVAALLLAGCSGAGLQTHSQILSQQAERYIAANPQLAERTKQDIRLARLHKGMSKNDVVAAWGRPIIVRGSETKGTEYWYFGCDWPHTCSYPDEDTDFPLIDEVYESQAQFKDGKLVYWRS